MALPERLFVIALVPQGERDPDRMTLYARMGADGVPCTPVFSSMLRATQFLEAAQALGHYVNLEYIFPAQGARFAQDFAEYAPALDPTPADFYGRAAAP